MNSVEKSCPKCGNKMTGVEIPTPTSASDVIGSAITTASGINNLKKETFAYTCEKCGYTEIKEYQKLRHS